MPVATNISHDSICARRVGVFSGRNLPVFSARYSRIALLSNTTASPSTSAGVFAFGLIAVKAGACCSPLRVSTGTSFVGQSGLFQKQRDLRRVGRGVVVELEHRYPLLREETIGTT